MIEILAIAVCDKCGKRIPLPSKNLGEAEAKLVERGWRQDGEGKLLCLPCATGTKRCSCCEEVKPLSEFNRSARHEHQAWCRKCSADKARSIRDGRVP